MDSGTDETTLSCNWALSDGHNKLIEALGRHEPFLPDSIVDNLDAMGRVVRLELSTSGTTSTSKELGGTTASETGVSLLA